MSRTWSLKNSVSNTACSVAFAMVLMAVAAHVAAQEYPNRPLRMVYPSSGGGAAEAIGRIAGQKLSEQLGQPVLMDFRPGAGGLIGTREVLKMQPLGYYILWANPAITNNLFAYKDPGYKLEDFETLGPLGLNPFGMVLHTSIPAKNLREFIAYAKANPNRINYGSVGPSNGAVILSERLKQAAGINMTQILYKGSGELSVALLAGDIHVYFATLGTAKTRMQSPQIIGIGMTADRRSDLLPDLPTFKELGYPTMMLSSWNALFVPAAAPRPVITRLRTAMDRIYAAPEWNAMLKKYKAEPWFGTIKEFGDKIKAEGIATGEDYKRLNLPLLD